MFWLKTCALASINFHTFVNLHSFRLFALRNRRVLNIWLARMFASCGNKYSIFFWFKWEPMTVKLQSLVGEMMNHFLKVFRLIAESINRTQKVFSEKYGAKYHSLTWTTVSWMSKMKSASYHVLFKAFRMGKRAKNSPRSNHWTRRYISCGFIK